MKRVVRNNNIMDPNKPETMAAQKNIKPGIKWPWFFFDPYASKKYKILVSLFALGGVLLAPFLGVLASSIGLDSNHIMLASICLGFAAATFLGGYRGFKNKQDVGSLGTGFLSPHVYMTGKTAQVFGIFQLLVALLLVIFVILVVGSPSFDNYLNQQINQTKQTH